MGRGADRLPALVDSGRALCYLCRRLGVQVSTSNQKAFDIDWDVAPGPAPAYHHHHLT